MFFSEFSLIFIEFPLIFIDFLWFWEAKEAGGGWRRLEAAWGSLGEPGGGWGLENVGFLLVLEGFCEIVEAEETKKHEKLKLSGRRGWAPEQPGASLGSLGEAGGGRRSLGGSLGEPREPGGAWGRLEEAGGEVCE